MRRVVHLVRHGEVENPAGVIYGTLPGFVLSERGRAQVEATAAHLRETLSSSVTLLSSPLERAKETASIVHRELSKRPGDGSTRLDAVAFDERVIEARSWTEGLPRSFAPRAFLSRWLDKSAHAEDEEPVVVAERMRRAILDALEAHPSRELVVVSHQFPIWMAQVAFAFRLGTVKAHPLARRWPWLFLRRRCSVASVTTIALDGVEVVEARYWEPSI